MRWLPVLLCLVGGAALASDDGERLVQTFVNGIETFQGGFRQTLLDPDGEILEETSGSLAIRRPGQFRWDNAEPYEQQLVADGLNIWSYDVDLEQVTVKPQADTLSNTPALILSGAQSALEQFTVVESYVEAAHTWVRLEPTSPDAGFTRMEMGFLDGRLDRLVFFDTLAQTTLVQFDDVVVNALIPAERFVFSVPEYADVIGTPAEAE
ncbi:MAG: outer membrane lipoprotein chaperone LolA [Pseudomonadota bacterium]